VGIEHGVRHIDARDRSDGVWHFRGRCDRPRRVGWSRHGAGLPLGRGGVVDPLAPFRGQRPAGGALWGATGRAI